LVTMLVIGDFSKEKKTVVISFPHEARNDIF